MKAECEVGMYVVSGRPYSRREARIVAIKGRKAELEYADRQTSKWWGDGEVTFVSLRPSTEEAFAAVRKVSDLHEAYREKMTTVPLDGVAAERDALVARVEELDRHIARDKAERDELQALASICRGVIHERERSG